jgi:hypothetical protein
VRWSGRVTRSGLNAPRRSARHLSCARPTAQEEPLTAPLAVVRERLRPSPMALLQQGVPLSLLLDLVLGPHSEELLELEGRPVRVR